ncbi:hypothetical protein [Paenibacillus eucommiae]|uniref:Uncharacterized protein n=1 Tax=Paenibacillus eucommiae TaxID=1355755 RepID=A0ABS4IPB0_9BACL|nr:hypothetical protein [Paenibacillus eucommiae]MBP1989394.1 hypothetical protein [Paenibacillus eucommiae]
MGDILGKQEEAERWIKEFDEKVLNDLINNSEQAGDQCHAVVHLLRSRRRAKIRSRSSSPQLYDKREVVGCCSLCKFSLIYKVIMIIIIYV